MILRRVIAHFRKQVATAPLIPAKAGTQRAPAGAPKDAYRRCAEVLDPGLRRDERNSRIRADHLIESLAP
ncbi:MAG TPA: hypothetical protein DEA50_10390 [Parvularcula sp.]|nr:hypothetical protein [Parvularcula sp.]